MVKVNSLRIAVAGAGYAGLGTAAHLVKYCSKLTLIEPAEIGYGGASGASSGLLHPFSPKAKLLWKGLEGFEETYRLVEKAQQSLPNEKIILQSDGSIIRPVFATEEYSAWQGEASEWTDFITLSRMRELIGKHSKTIIPSDCLGGILYKKCHVIDSRLYLQGLNRYIANQAKDVSCEYSIEKTVIDKDNLQRLSSEYDVILLTVGATIKHIWPSDTNKLTMTYMPGQNLIYETPYSREISILRGEYIVPLATQSSKAAAENVNQRLLCGSSKLYVKDFPIDGGIVYNVPMEVSAKALSHRLTVLDNSLNDLQPLSSFGGIRVVSNRCHIGRLPKMGKFPKSDNIWFFTGLGTKGLIHHGLLGSWLANAIIQNNPSLLPPEVLYHSHSE